ncbi:unnamed protein product, partial [Mesorhabditis belari]|uniref:Uncharacterized protein n=1 Tax=Mesorhabditis belari TaxID=2138241 RepID=A0AAF3FBZ3_9BILA
MSSKPIFILLGCLVTLSVSIKHEADGSMTHDHKGLRSYRSAQMNEIEELRREVRDLVESIRGQWKNNSETDVGVNSRNEPHDVGKNEKRQFPSTLSHFDETSTPTVPSKTPSHHRLYTPIPFLVQMKVQLNGIRCCFKPNPTIFSIKQCSRFPRTLWTGRISSRSTNDTHLFIRAISTRPHKKAFCIIVVK